MQDPVTRFAGTAERERLEQCVREAIRTPGRIQAHGILLGVDPSTSMITLVSDNATGWLGRMVADLESPSIEWSVRSGSQIDPTRVELDGRAYDAIVHTAAGRTIVELEPVLVDLQYARTSVVGAIQRLAAFTSIDALRAAIATEIRAITGFDRVMVYHFFEDEHGEVVAEDRADDMEPYLGLHFPASDIPLQARDLYVSKLSRAIVSTEDPGSQLLALHGSEVETVDLSAAELRAVSPHHIQFMRNMGQESTVSLSLVRDGRLTGMITCAHRTERRLPVLLRRALEVLAVQLSMQLSSLETIARLEHDLRVRSDRAALLAPLYASDDVAGVLLDGECTVLDLVAADAAIVLLDGSMRIVGDVDPAAATALLTAIGDREVVTDALGNDEPELAAMVPQFAGLLAVPLGEGHGSLVFLREEVTRIVTWLGDQTPANRPDVLSPRLSFSAWRESVTGRSRSWWREAAGALELGAEVTETMVRRAQGRLGELAMRDALTGLFNRRQLTRELEHWSGSHALLYIDLDEFKQVNDSLGHDAGDAVLIEVARRLSATARAGDTVARIGGDEFVVLAEGMDAAAATALAERILDAFRAPIDTPAGTVVITASCGVSLADLATGSPLELADAAMYRAKRGGRDRVSFSD